MKVLLIILYVMLISNTLGDKCTTRITQDKCNEPVRDDIGYFCGWFSQFEPSCRRVGDYPPSGRCTTQRKFKTCVNWNNCIWNQESNACIEKVSTNAPTQYPTRFLNNNEELFYNSLNLINKILTKEQMKMVIERFMLEN